MDSLQVVAVVQHSKQWLHLKEQVAQAVVVLALKVELQQLV
jgi:hypothetical protein